MRKDLERKIGSTIFERLNATHMSDAERETAISAMLTADLLVDAMTWVTRKVERLGARLFLKPSLKH